MSCRLQRIFHTETNQEIFSSNQRVHNAHATPVMFFIFFAIVGIILLKTNPLSVIVNVDTMKWWAAWPTLSYIEKQNVEISEVIDSVLMSNTELIFKVADLRTCSKLLFRRMRKFAHAHNNNLERLSTVFYVRLLNKCGNKHKTEQMHCALSWCHTLVISESDLIMIPTVEWLSI